MGVRQGLACLISLLPLSFIGVSVAFAQATPAGGEPTQAPAQTTPPAPAPAPVPAKPDSPRRPAPQQSVTNTCPAATPEVENQNRLRVLPAPSAAKKYKIRLDKGGSNVGLPAPAGAPVPNKDECFYVLGENNTDVVAELAFRKAQKNKKGISVWVFSPIRRSDAGKTTLNKFAVKASEATAAGAGGAGSDSADLASGVLPGENALILPSFVVIQNAQHQAANVRSGVALNIPVSGYGLAVEGFVPKQNMSAWTNMFGLRATFISWTADKFSFKKPVANEVQDAEATGSSVQLDVMFRYPLSLRLLPRIGFFVSPYSSQTETLKVAAGLTSPQNTQTLVRSGLLLGAEVEVNPAGNLFLNGRVTFSSKETVSVKDESEPGDSLSGSGTASRMHLTGMAGVRLPLSASRRVVFEGLVGNSYRSDKYSSDVAFSGQTQQKDIITFFQGGVGFIF